MDIVGQLQEGMRRFSAQESRVATFILQNLRKVRFNQS